MGGSTIELRILPTFKASCTNTLPSYLTFYAYFYDVDLIEHNHACPFATL